MTSPRFSQVTRQRVFRSASLGGLVFAGATFLAMWLYPGGTISEPAAEGYRFGQNFFSDLGRTEDFEGNSNLISMLLFSGGLLTVGCTTAAFFVALPDLFGGSSRFISVLMTGSGLLAGIGFFGIAITPWDLMREAHDFCVNLGFRSLLLACLAAMANIYRTRSFPNGFGHLMVLVSAILLGYILLLQFGPSVSTPRGLMIQVGGQKVVAYVLVGGITALAFGASRVNQQVGHLDQRIGSTEEA